MSDTILIAIIVVASLGAIVNAGRAKPKVAVKASTAFTVFSCIFAAAIMALWVVYGLAGGDWLVAAAVLAPMAVTLVFATFRAVIEP